MLFCATRVFLSDMKFFPSLTAEQLLSPARILREAWNHPQLNGHNGHVPFSWAGIQQKFCWKSNIPQSLPDPCAVSLARGDSMADGGWGWVELRAVTLPQCYARCFQQHTIIPGDLFWEVWQNWNIHFAQTTTLENRRRFHLVIKHFLGLSFPSCWIQCSWGYTTKPIRDISSMEGNTGGYGVVGWLVLICFAVFK